MVNECIFFPPPLPLALGRLLSHSAAFFLRMRVFTVDGQDNAHTHTAKTVTSRRQRYQSPSTFTGSFLLLYSLFLILLRFLRLFLPFHGHTTHTRTYKQQKRMLTNKGISLFIVLHASHTRIVS